MHEIQARVFYYFVSFLGCFDVGWNLCSFLDDSPLLSTDEAKGMIVSDDAKYHIVLFVFYFLVFILTQIPTDIRHLYHCLPPSSLFPLLIKGESA